MSEYATLLYEQPATHVARIVLNRPDTRNAQEAYSTMRDALAATGRPIVFSMCEWGTAKPWQWAQTGGPAGAAKSRPT